MRRALWWVAVTVLLLPALLLTLTRLFEPRGARWVQLEAFTPLAAAPYAVLVLLAGLVAWRGRDATAVAVALVAVVGLGLHGWWFAPLVSGANPPAAAEAETLTVMTANMHLGDADGIELVASASEVGADILVVQEVTAPLLVDMERAGLAALFPHRAGEPGDSAEGTMVFAAVELGEARLVATTWDSWLVEAGELTLLAVHPHAPSDIGRWRADHELLSRTTTEEEPDLVVGDFNATPDHPPMRALAGAGWRSATELANEGWHPTWSPSGYFVVDLQLPALVQVDHVLVGRDLAAQSAHTVEIAGSDHRALVAEVAAK